MIMLVLPLCYVVDDDVGLVMVVGVVLLLLMIVIE